jgi:hypothetical protein
LAQIPVNVIYYGAHGTEPWKVDPTQHLGFLFTLLGFTVAATPAAWGMIKQYVILGASISASRSLGRASLLYDFMDIRGCFVPLWDSNRTSISCGQW